MAEEYDTHGQYNHGQYNHDQYNSGQYPYGQDPRSQESNLALRFQFGQQQSPYWLEHNDSQEYNDGQEYNDSQGSETGEVLNYFDSVAAERCYNEWTSMLARKEYVLPVKNEKREWVPGPSGRLPESDPFEQQIFNCVYTLLHDQRRQSDEDRILYAVATFNEAVKGVDRGHDVQLGFLCLAYAPAWARYEEPQRAIETLVEFVRVALTKIRDLEMKAVFLRNLECAFSKPTQCEYQTTQSAVFSGRDTKPISMYRLPRIVFNKSSDSEGSSRVHR